MTAYRASYDPVLVDRDGFILDHGDRDWQLADQARPDFEKDGRECDAEMFCHICNAYPMFVELDPVDEKSSIVYPIAAKCFRCGLDIRREDEHLARIHVGEIPEEDIKRFLKDIGHI